MKVYVLSAWGYDDDWPLGVFLTAEEARAARPGPWVVRHRGPVPWADWRKRCNEDPAEEKPGWSADGYNVVEVDFFVSSDDPIRAFAVAALEGDPQATDAIRDVLKL